MRDAMDVRLTDAFRDVPVPAGLAERLLDRLAIEPSHVRPNSRRRLFVGSGLLTAAAGLLVALWLGTQGDERFSEQFALDAAIQSFDARLDEPGHFLAEQSAPAEYPPSQWVLHVRETSWRPLEDFLGRRGVVYDLPGPGGTQAALYVVARDDVEGVGTSPALHPFTTGGCCASAWQEGGLLYVLVVQGDPAAYGRYLNLPRSPVA